MQRVENVDSRSTDQGMTEGAVLTVLTMTDPNLRCNFNLMSQLIF
uniref:Uncharacterized protein n=1 Tax=Medicago truncatula TaxID=3880 RepID=A2Q4E6_MEDTR|nr:hypothetical protein MtrDRAFT_AC157473g11v2 [Medicago truncatula]